jgi:hypothetical protein
MNDHPTHTRPLAFDDDSGMGLAMFVSFIAACLIVTGAVAMLALINTWWVLGLAFGIHVIMTTIVGFAVFAALNGRASAITERESERAPEASRAQPAPRREAVAAH